jgi:uncharacterized protein
MTITNLGIELPQEQINAFCHRHAVQELSLFGSVLRDDFGPESDIDVLFTLASGNTMSIEKYLEMRDQLSAMFAGREIDLVQNKLVRNPFRRQEILATREILYAA